MTPLGERRVLECECTTPALDGELSSRWLLLGCAVIFFLEVVRFFLRSVCV